MHSKCQLLLLLPLFVSTAFAATHVNISIAQHPADVRYVDGEAPAELKAGPGHQVSDERVARLRSAEADGGNSDNSNDERVSQQLNEERVAQVVGQGAAVGMDGDRHDAQVQYVGSNSQLQHQSQQQQQRGYNVRRYQQNRQSQFRPANSQDKQNQEFERYIQSYHSGPTVETVFDSASPSSHTAPSSSSATSQRLVSIGPNSPTSHTFERQVALHSTATPVDHQHSNEVSTDAKLAVTANSPALSSSVSSASSTSVVASPTTVIAGGNYDGNKAVSGVGVGIGQPSYGQETTYSKSGSIPTNYNYDNTQTSFSNEYPPLPEEPHDGYGGYYNGEQDFSPSTGYLPTQNVYQRPVVTKTIQIAQPALKAKKFEVRHPAIQKEFYDIEERVVIKPAGTIVVELEHPVAKIPKGETVLPLGHPHPAIAGEYNLNGHSAIQTESSSAGSYQSGARPKTNTVFMSRKSPAPVISGTTIASTVTSTPTNDYGAKNDFVEANLKKQYVGDSASDDTYREQPKRGQDLFTPADTHGNQRQVSNRNLSPNMFVREESSYSRPAHVEVKYNGAPQRPSFAQREKTSFNFNAPQYPGNYKNDDEDDDQYKGEYITGNFYNNPKDPKPARLQEQPPRQSVAEPQTHIIKHEHNIHLPPSQHNIYLSTGRLENRPAFVPQQQQRPRNEGSTARVQELKPYLQQHQGNVVVYASTTMRPAPKRYSLQESRSQLQPQQSTQYGQQRNTYGQLRSYNENGRQPRVEYSAPYSNMRYDPHESARLTAYEANNQYVDNNNSNKEVQRTFTVSYSRPQETKARLTAQDNEKDVEAQQKTESKADVQSIMRPQTHIQIQVPQGPHESHKPIMVMSTIHPPMDQPQPTYHKQAYTATDDEVERFTPDNVRGNQQYGVHHAARLEIQPDCDQNGNKLSTTYKDIPQNNEQSSRLVETPNSANSDVKNEAHITQNIPSKNVDVNVKSTTGHVGTPGSRVIAATPAPTDASAASESFHKRRIVVNHPFQTVREVVEHEPITNYHQIQVNEPASPELYHKASYYAPSGALRQYEVSHVGVPALYHHATSSATHGNLVYALPDTIPVHENTDDVDVSYHSRQRQRFNA